MLGSVLSCFFEKYEDMKKERAVMIFGTEGQISHIPMNEGSKSQLSLPHERTDLCRIESATQGSRRSTSLTAQPARIPPPLSVQ